MNQSMRPANHSEGDIFNAALACTTAQERAAYLDQACGTHPELRQRIEALLAAHFQAARFMKNPPAPGNLNPTIRLELPDEENPGDIIGNYKIREKIGEGGCGVVYVADQEQPVRRRVALKVIKLGMDTKQVVARFEAERQALAIMDHPNIAKVLDAGATSQGRPFFVMELVRGIRITDYCDQANLTTKERLALFIKVCQAIQHAHQKGIIHRDIKPSNILVTVNDGVPVPKVIDFGIAKATEGRLAEATVYTQLHQFIGTPAYMSPEQAEMSSLDIDTRSDIYSLGVLLYELLSGHTPFDPKELMAVGLDAMRKAIREQEPARPSTKLASLNGEQLSTTAKRRSVEPPKLLHQLQGDLDWIAMKCLEKDRTRRYETANGLAADVRRHLNDEPVTAGAPSAGYKLRKFVKRNRTQVLVAGLVLLMLVGGIVGTSFGLVEAKRQERLAEQRRQEAVAAAAETKLRADELAKVSEFQANMLSQIDATDAGVKLMSGIKSKFAAALEKSGVSAAERTARAGVFEQELVRVNATDTAVEMINSTILKPAIKAIGIQFTNQPAVDAKLRQTLADLYRTLGFNDEATVLNGQALATQRRVLPADHPDTLLSINNQGVLLEAQGKLPEAEKFYREALDKRQRVLGEDAPDTLTSMGNLGNLYRSQARFAEAEPLLKSSVEKSRRVRGAENRDTLIAINCLGYLFVDQGKLDATEPLWREAYETGRRALGPEDPDVLVWINNLAGLLQAQSKYKEAEPLFIESLEKHRRIRGEEHPATIQAIEGLASAYVKQGRFPEAEPLYREALEKSRRVLGNEHPETLGCMNNLGDLLYRQGRLSEGEAYLRDSLAVWRRVQGDDHPDTLTAMSQLGLLLANQGKFSEAEALYRESLDKSRRRLPADHPDSLVRMVNLGNLLVQMRRLDEAETFIREALAARQRVSGEDHPETLIAYSNLGALVEQQGKLAEAEQIDRTVLEKFRKVLGPDHPNSLNAIANLGGMLRTAGRPAEAESLYREAVSGMERKLGKEHARTASARLGLGRTLAALNRFPEAETELQEAGHLLATVQGVPASRRRQSVEALADLYAAWNKADPGHGHDTKAAEWKQKLAASAAPAAEKKP